MVSLASASSSITRRPSILSLTQCVTRAWRQGCITLETRLTSVAPWGRPEAWLLKTGSCRYTLAHGNRQSCPLHDSVHRHLGLDGRGACFQSHDRLGFARSAISLGQAFLRRAAAIPQRGDALRQPLRQLLNHWGESPGAFSLAFHSPLSRPSSTLYPVERDHCARDTRPLVQLPGAPIGARPGYTLPHTRTTRQEAGGTGRRSLAERITGMR